MPDDSNTQASQVFNLAVTVARIDGKLDTVLTNLNRIIDTQDNHEERIEAMEKKWNIAKGVTVVGTFVGTLLTYLFYGLNLFHGGKG